MKKCDLEKAVLANGAKPIEGTKHDKWLSRTDICSQYRDTKRLVKL